MGQQVATAGLLSWRLLNQAMRLLLLATIGLLLMGQAAGLVLIDEPASRALVGAEDGWLVWMEDVGGQAALRVRHVDDLGTSHAAETLAGTAELVRAAVGAGHVAVVVSDQPPGPQRPKDLWVMPLDGGAARKVAEEAVFLGGPRGDDAGLVWSTFDGNQSLIHRVTREGTKTFDVSDQTCLLPQAWPAGSMVAWTELAVQGCPRPAYHAFDVASPDDVMQVPIEAIALNTGSGWLSFVGFALHSDGWYIFGAANLTGDPWKVVPTTIRPLWAQASDDRFVWLENPEEHPPQDRPYRLAGVGQRFLAGGGPGFLDVQLEYTSLPVLDGDRLYYNGAQKHLEALVLPGPAEPRSGIPWPSLAFSVAVLAALAATGRRGS